jgi:hypothetical protein
MSKKVSVACKSSSGALNTSKNGRDATSSKRFLELLIETLALMRERLSQLERERGD